MAFLKEARTPTTSKQLKNIQKNPYIPSGGLELGNLGVQKVYWTTVLSIDFVSRREFWRLYNKVHCKLISSTNDFIPKAKKTLKLNLSNFSRGIQFFSFPMLFYIAKDPKKPIKNILTYFKIRNTTLNEVYPKATLWAWLLRYKSELPRTTLTKVIKIVLLCHQPRKILKSFGPTT